MQNLLNTKKETIKQIQLILNKPFRTRRILSTKEFNFVHTILEHHPEFNKKEKCGIEDIFIKKTIYNNNGFFIRRLDGTITDFSYLKCINGSNKLQEIKSMFRSAIRPQIVSFKYSIFNSDNEVICPITKKKLNNNNCHVDHYKPTFNQLFKKFIKEEGVDLNKLEVGGQNKDNSMNYYFLDKKLEKNWYDFHFFNSELRITSIQGNLRRKRNEY